MHQQTVAFARLWRWTERASKMYRYQPDGRLLSELHIPLLDINPEGKLEREIKDIVEELGIMVYIKKTEKSVLTEFVGHALKILDPKDEFEPLRPQSPAFSILSGRHPSIDADSPIAGSPTAAPSRNEAGNADQKAARDAHQWFKTNARDLLRRVDGRIGHLEELHRSAESTATMVRAQAHSSKSATGWDADMDSQVKDLLELKQQQAGVVQAWQAVNQSNEAIKQGRSILVFTIVTIVFVSFPPRHNVWCETDGCGATASALVHVKYLRHECGRVWR